MSGTNRAAVDAVMATYGATPWTPSPLPAGAGWYYQMSNPTRTICLPLPPATVTDLTAWATALATAAALTQG